MATDTQALADTGSVVEVYFDTNALSDLFQTGSARKTGLRRDLKAAVRQGRIRLMISVSALEELSASAEKRWTTYLRPQTVVRAPQLNRRNSASSPFSISSNLVPRLPKGRRVFCAWPWADSALGCSWQPSAMCVLRRDASSAREREPDRRGARSGLAAWWHGHPLDAASWRNRKHVPVVAAG
jgi:hypothetical protein